MNVDYKELMIGDWVSLFQGKKDGSSCNVKVTSLWRDYEVDIEGEDCEYDSANPALLFPIPLTGEILEASGFEHCSSRALFEEYRMCFDEDTDDETWLFIEIHPKNEHCPYRWAKIHYQPCFGFHHNGIETKINDCMVHDLQHVLRIAKIDKKVNIQVQH